MLCCLRTAYGGVEEETGNKSELKVVLGEGKRASKLSSKAL